MEGERIAKVIARAGVCSRREAEKLIAAGKISVDGKIITSAALNVTDKSRIEVDGVRIGAPERTRVWLFNKPVGIITSNKDKESRKTVFEILPENMPRVISVGRLDLNSEGLLLLTNNGELSRYMELPETGLLRKYRVRAYGSTTQEQLDKLKDGLEIFDKINRKKIIYREIEARIEKAQNGRNIWLNFTLKEGKNREIRKICEHIGLKVNRLIRTAYGSFELGTLEPGKIKEIPYTTIREKIGKFL